MKSGAPSTAPLRILLVTEYSPFTTQTFGAQQRTLLLWRALSIIGRVDILLLRAGAGTSTEASTDPRVTVEASYATRFGDLGKYWKDRKLTRLLRQRVALETYDVICARHFPPLLKLDLPEHIRTVVDLDDAGYVYARFGKRGVRAAKAALKGQVRNWLQRWAVKRFDRFWFVSDRDRARFPHLKGGVLPNIPMVGDPVPPANSASQALLFVGALWYGPNVEGLERFLTRVWPIVRNELPGARFFVIGGAPAEQRARWATNQGVHPLGFVDNIADYYERCTATVVPIYSGGGSNIKLLEALAFGRACVTTKFCAGAFAPELQPGVHFLVGEGDAAFAECCVRLLRDRDERDRLVAAGLAAVSLHFAATRFNKAVAEQVQAVLKDSPRGRS